MRLTWRLEADAGAGRRRSAGGASRPRLAERPRLPPRLLRRRWLPSPPPPSPPPPPRRPAPGPPRLAVGLQAAVFRVLSQAPGGLLAAPGRARASAAALARGRGTLQVESGPARRCALPAVLIALFLGQWTHAAGLAVGGGGAALGRARAIAAAVTPTAPALAAIPPGPAPLGLLLRALAERRGGGELAARKVGDVVVMDVPALARGRESRVEAPLRVALEIIVELAARVEDLVHGESSSDLRARSRA